MFMKVLALFAYPSQAVHDVLRQHYLQPNLVVARSPRSGYQTIRMQFEYFHSPTPGSIVCMMLAISSRKGVSHFCCFCNYEGQIYLSSGRACRVRVSGFNIALVLVFFSSAFCRHTPWVFVTSIHSFTQSRYQVCILTRGRRSLSTDACLTYGSDLS
ncbi:uncharacterized protein LY79DRAFT_253255 [Colletotrichum navitas]|uniref:Uncharacterized protein n=1 Tax=Colletotrichum navitas TaxID=681940 RepID=A0AAD8QB13_9PEZI|nr:uncharacterized protein LY79DRAFT_253255 [Colletotrichum navitas]KAK1598721.1 hypothetical protein LY79DRAFT_253255 [Colletotrichum navitas]